MHNPQTCRKAGESHTPKKSRKAGKSHAKPHNPNPSARRAEKRTESNDKS